MLEFKLESDCPKKKKINKNRECFVNIRDDDFVQAARGGNYAAQAMVAAMTSSSTPTRGRGRGSRGGGSPRGRKLGLKLKRLDGGEYVGGRGGGRGSRGGGTGLRGRKREGVYNSDYLYYMQQQQQQQQAAGGDHGLAR